MAEPVRHETLERFANHFASVVSEEGILSVYGLRKQA